LIPAIIPFYRARQKLERCLTHLRAQTRTVEPIVIDNSETNRYFTRAVNEGLRTALASAAPYALVLNQDMYLAPEAVERLALYLDRNPTTGIAAPLHLSETHPGHVDFGGGEDAYPLGHYLSGPVSAFTADREVYWVSGACMLIRLAMVLEIGLFDANLRFLASDSDYCFTARARGWRVAVVHEARGTHDAGASQSPQNDAALERIKAEDLIYFAEKWLTGALYRRLAAEGTRLQRDQVDDAVRQFEGVRAQLAR
jgi:GT2 family glycosyltransferase